MTKRCIVAVAAVLPLLMVAGYANAAASGPNMSYGYIQSSNNGHNFSKHGWADNQICKPCHTPHLADKYTAYSTRLWAHQVSNATYTVDSSGGTQTAEQALDRISRLCMGCHDGVNAPGDYTYSPNPAGGSLGTSAIVGTNLTTNHPVGKDAVYQVRPSLKPTVDTKDSAGVVTRRSVGTATATTAALPLVRVLEQDATGNITRDEFVVGCTTCHHPHGTRTGDYTANPPGTDPEPNLLRMNNTASNLCLTCHNK